MHSTKKQSSPEDHTEAMPLRPKTILVTGGGGYIGTHIVEQLLRRNYRVRVYDQFVFGKKILADLLDHRRLEVIRGEIGDVNKLCRAFEGIDEVVHLAGLVGDLACLVDKDFTVYMNVFSTRIVKDLAIAFKVQKFIFASSCSVYGASNEAASEESPLSPVSLYAKTKIDSEEELLHEKDNRFHPVILRFATVFGHSRRQRFDLVANLFTAQAYCDGILTVIGGQQWRPFIHVSDVARAVVAIVDSPLTLVDRQIFNVGNDALNITIENLAAIVSRVVVKDSRGNKIKVSVDDDQTDNRNYRVSSAKIKKRLNFRAKISFDEGIDEMYQNLRTGVYKNHYKDPAYVNLEMTKLMQVKCQY